MEGMGLLETEPLQGSQQRHGRPSSEDEGTSQVQVCYFAELIPAKKFSEKFSSRDGNLVPTPKPSM